MHTEQIKAWQHNHVFNAEKKTIEKRTLIVVVITFATMIAEIFFGWLTSSMALLADGWHMGTHAFALGISLSAYILARKYAQDARFAFGAWKIEILGAYTSAIVLGLAGLFLLVASVERMINPLSIRYNQALLVAVIGLIVNALCAVILNADEEPHDLHHDASGRSCSHNDLNQRSAYLHVVADAVTSVLAIIALMGAKYFQFIWLDPLMGIVGAGLILRWSALLLKDASNILLQREMDSPIAVEIKDLIESDGHSRITDLHIWRVAQDKFACILSLVSDGTYSIDEYKERLKNVDELAHVTIEINPSPEEPSERLHEETFPAPPTGE